MRITAYVDGFSVYYACFRGPTKAKNAPYKWLNYRLLMERIFPDDQVECVRVYTAIAPNPPHDPGQAVRHDMYLRALRTLDRVAVHAGRFQKSKREAVLVRPPNGVPRLQTVYIYQEKKTDVSLATHMLLDAFDDRFDRAVVMTNDTDFVAPIQTVRDRFGKEVLVVSPDTTLNKELAKAATRGMLLDHGLIPSCQLENPVFGPDGRPVHKPERW